MNSSSSIYVHLFRKSIYIKRVADAPRTTFCPFFYKLSFVSTLDLLIKAGLIHKPNTLPCFELASLIIWRSYLIVIF